MGIIKLLLGIIIAFFTSVSWGQNATLEHKNEPSRNIRSSKKMVKLTQLYFEETNLLKTYFIKGEVIDGFPGYNYALSKDVNANEITKWLAYGKNKNLLTPEGLVAIELYTKSK